MNKYLTNIVALLGERLIGIPLAFVVSLLAARILGPSLYGELNYILSCIALSAIFLNLGLELVVIREIVKQPDITSEILSTTFALRFFGSFIAFIVVIVLVLHFEQPGSIVVASTVLFMRVPHAIAYFFQAKVNSQKIAMTNVFALTIGAMVKVAILFVSPKVLNLILVDIFVAAIISLIYLFLYGKDGATLESRVNVDIARSLLSSALPLLLSSTAIVIFSKFDQIMITNMMGPESNGIYAIASSCSAALFFIPTIISSTLYPKLIHASNDSVQEFNNQTTFQLEIMLIVVIPISLMAWFVYPKLLSAGFGEVYYGSVGAFNFMVFSIIPVALGVGSNKWLLARGLEKVVFHRTLFGAAANVVLNYLLIPTYGIDGAAFSSLMAFSISSIFGNLISQQTRDLFVIQMKSFRFINTIDFIRKERKNIR